MSTTLIAHKEKELKKLGVELKTVREKMESDFAEKGASDTADVEKFDKIYADGQLLKGEIERLREGEKLVKYANGEEEEPKQQQFVPAQKQGFQSWGVTLVNSESFKSAQKSGFRSPKDIATRRD
jgi:hypothetical protein